MIFIIDYDRARGQLAHIEVFADTERHEAEDKRLVTELTHHRKGVKHEVVLLQAANEQALRETHRRYFADITTLIGSQSRGSNN